MPQIDWPKWTIPVGVSAGEITVTYAGHRPAFGIGERIRLAGQTRWLQIGSSETSWRVATNDDGTGIVVVTGSSATVEKDAAIVVNYPSRPMLRDPGAQTNASLTNPMRISSRSISEPRFEGSVELDVMDPADVPIVEAFIDRLSDPDAWFELPLPGSHIGANDVDAYSAGDLTISSAFMQDYLLGWFGRVGRRTVRVVDDRRDGSGNHVIRIVPDLIDGTTAQASANVFSSAKTCRVRAVDVRATGNPSFDASWSITWVETMGDV